ncbi:hypothetical protein ACSX1A_07955 [Pontibacter sp. MBLB2868]|uniref:hypothetical protein n=1 Tax=Pontibacter sp. MBLB2868 TaxID=3451555 RepID=UPI003F751A71
MDLNHLKQGWQNAGTQEKLSQQQLAQMTSINSHPVLGRIRRKLAVEAVTITVLLFVFYDIFDGDQKPAYASVLLVLCAIFYLASNVYSYFTLKKPITSLNILDSLQHFLLQLQKARVFSLTSLVLFSVGLWVFFFSALPLDAKRLLILAGMAGVTLVFFYLSARLWAHWISRIRQSVHELSE